MLFQFAAGDNGVLGLNPIVFQLGISWLVSHGIEIAKKSRLSWISQHSVDLNKNLSTAAAVVTSIGVTWATTGDFLSGGSLTLHWPGLAPALRAGLPLLFNGIFSRMATEILYQKTVRDPKPETLVAVGEMTAPSGKPMGKVEITGLSAESGSPAAQQAVAVVAATVDQPIILTSAPPPGGEK